MFIILLLINSITQYVNSFTFLIDTFDDIIVVCVLVVNMAANTKCLTLFLLMRNYDDLKKKILIILHSSIFYPILLTFLIQKSKNFTVKA